MAESSERRVGRGGKGQPGNLTTISCGDSCDGGYGFSEML
jgi:hypothetical protein